MMVHVSLPDSSLEAKIVSSLFEAITDFVYERRKGETGEPPAQASE